MQFLQVLNSRSPDQRNVIRQLLSNDTVLAFVQDVCKAQRDAIADRVRPNQSAEELMIEIQPLLDEHRMTVAMLNIFTTIANIKE